MDELLRATARAGARHFWFRGFRWFVAPLIRQAIDGRTRPRLLDCGCGTGGNLDLLARFGTSYGFDLSEVGLYIGRQAGRTKLARATVIDAPFLSNAFDVVTSFDVLYSLQELEERAALAEMYRLVRPGGYVVINVAAMPILRGDHSILSRELRRYTRAGLSRLVAGAGFEVVRLTYTNQSLFVPMLFIRAVHRWRGLAAESEAHREISVPPSPINALLSGLLFAESLWLRRMNNWVGSSLLCLARKPAEDRSRIREVRDGADRSSAGCAPPARRPGPSQS